MSEGKWPHQAQCAKCQHLPFTVPRWWTDQQCVIGAQWWPMLPRPLPGQGIRRRCSVASAAVGEADRAGPPSVGLSAFTWHHQREPHGTRGSADWDWLFGDGYGICVCWLARPRPWRHGTAMVAQQRVAWALVTLVLAGQRPSWRCLCGAIMSPSHRMHRPRTRAFTFHFSTSRERTRWQFRRRDPTVRTVQELLPVVTTLMWKYIVNTTDVEEPVCRTQGGSFIVLPMPLKVHNWVETRCARPAVPPGIPAPSLPHLLPRC
jgi:hypothetical protein